MSRAAIVAPVRTAVGRFGGTLRPVPAVAKLFGRPGLRLSYGSAPA